MIKGRRPVDPVSRFLAKFTPADSAVCWEWQAARDRQGYGAFSMPGGKVVKAHRFSYAHYVGSIPEGALVLHSCDNPPCVNPHHLRTGTVADNTQDSADRGRHRNARKVTCPNGHVLERVKATDRRRRCPVCHPAQIKAWLAAHRTRQIVHI